MAIGLGGVVTDGYREQILTYRVSPELAARHHRILTATSTPLVEDMFDDGACRFWAATVTPEFEDRFASCAARFGPTKLVLGDSHAMNIYNAFARSGHEPFVVGVVQGGCRPHDNKPMCQYDGFDVFAQDHAREIDKVIYHQSGAYFIADEAGRVDSQIAFDTGDYDLQITNIEAAQAYLAALSDKSGIETIWLGLFPEYRREPSLAAFSENHLLMHPRSVAIFDRLNSFLDTRFETVDTFEYVAFRRMFQVPDIVDTGDCFLFRDKDHFSTCGETMIGQTDAVRRLLSEID